MSARSTKSLEAALVSKGFCNVGTHHEMYWLCVHGKRTSIRTRISHGAKEYGDSLLGEMARQLKLRRRDFDDLIDCPLTAEGYLGLLAKGGHLKLNAADGNQG